MKQAHISPGVQCVCGRGLTSSHPVSRSLFHFPSSLTASGTCEMVPKLFLPRQRSCRSFSSGKLSETEIPPARLSLHSSMWFLVRGHEIEEASKVWALPLKCVFMTAVSDSMCLRLFGSVTGCAKEKNERVLMGSKPYYRPSRHVWRSFFFPIFHIW